MQNDANETSETHFVTVYQKRNGWFHAECETLPGLLVAHESYEKLLAIIPKVMEAMLSIKYDKLISVSYSS